LTAAAFFGDGEFLLLLAEIFQAHMGHDSYIDLLSADIKKES